ncbi:MAG: EF-hand domain-containing protein [Ramlibacter sp.]
MHLKKRLRIANFETRSVALFTALALGAGLAAAQPGAATSSPTPPKSQAGSSQTAGAVPPNRWTAAQIEEAFRKTDKDRDGKITRQEATVWTGLSRQFGLVDTNRDGNISSAEFDEALK